MLTSPESPATCEYCGSLYVGYVGYHPQTYYTGSRAAETSATLAVPRVQLVSLGESWEGIGW